MVSDGTDTVVIDGNAVKFPTTVTDAAGRTTAAGSRSSMPTTTSPPPGRTAPTSSADQGRGRRTPVQPDLGPLADHFHALGRGRVVRLRQVGHAAVRGDRFVGGIGDMDHNELPGNNAAPSSSRDGLLVYQHDGRQGLEVWVLDNNAREPVASSWTKGSAGEISPDHKLAMLAPNGQISVISAVGEPDRKPVQVTFGVDSPSHLAWLSDASRIAFQTPTGVGSVAVDVPAGATDNPVTELSATSGCRASPRRWMPSPASIPPMSSRPRSAPPSNAGPTGRRTGTSRGPGLRRPSHRRRSR